MNGSLKEAVEDCGTMFEGRMFRRARRIKGCNPLRMLPRGCLQATTPGLPFYPVLGFSLFVTGRIPACKQIIMLVVVAFAAGKPCLERHADACPG